MYSELRVADNLPRWQPLERPTCPLYAGAAVHYDTSSVHYNSSGGEAADATINQY